MSACGQNVIMCGCLYVNSLLSAVCLSLYILVSIFERLFMYAEFAGGAAGVKQSNFHIESLVFIDIEKVNLI